MKFISDTKEILQIFVIKRNSGSDKVDSNNALHLILATILSGPHITNEKTKAQKDEWLFQDSKRHSQDVNLCLLQPRA